MLTVTTEPFPGICSHQKELPCPSILTFPRGNPIQRLVVEDLVSLFQFGTSLKGHQLQCSLWIGDCITLRLLCTLLLPSLLFTPLLINPKGMTNNSPTHKPPSQILLSQGHPTHDKPFHLLSEDRNYGSVGTSNFHFPLLYWGYKDKSFF